jgi:hypothetical protein
MAILPTNGSQARSSLAVRTADKILDRGGFANLRKLLEEVTASPMSPSDEAR